MLFSPENRQAKFQQIVNERGRELRALPYEQLKSAGTTPTQKLSIDSRDATVDIVVQERPGGALRVVVQGFMNTRPFRGIKRVALDGFYKYPDETVATMPEEEFYEFD